MTRASPCWRGFANRSEMPPAKCPFLHRCNKYTELTLRIDRLVESNAAKDRRIAALEAENAALKAAQTGSPSNPADVRIFGSSTPSSLIPIRRTRPRRREDARADSPTATRDTDARQSRTRKSTRPSS